MSTDRVCRINIKPLSMGRIWSTGKHGKRFLTTEGSNFKKLVGIEARKSFPEMINFSGKIHFEAKFYGNWHTKKGEISKTAGDLDNFNKLIIDGIAELMGFNDAQIFKISTEKIDADTHFFEFRIEKV